MEKHDRFINKETMPTKQQIKNALGKTVFIKWNEVTSHIDSAYDIVPEQVYGGKNYGWSFKYRKSGKTLCSIFPEKESFTILIVFAKEDIEHITPNFPALSHAVRNLINETRQYYDGKWVKFRFPTDGSVDDIITLLAIKLRPNLTSAL